MALLLAVAVAVGGYALLLGMRSVEVEAANGPAVALPRQPADLPAVRRLERLPPVQPASVGRSVLPRPGGQLRVRVAAMAEPGAGVAVFDAGTGALVRWIALAEAAADGGQLLLACEVPSGTYRLHLAGSAEVAALDWWAVTDCEVGADAVAEADLVAAPQAVEITVGIGGKPAGEGTLFRLQRVGGPPWRLSGPAGSRAGLRSDAQGSLRARLGPGDYELAPVGGQGGPAFRFTVPAPGRLRADFPR